MEWLAAVVRNKSANNSKLTSWHLALYWIKVFCFPDSHDSHDSHVTSVKVMRNSNISGIKVIKENVSGPVSQVVNA